MPPVSQAVQCAGLAFMLLSVCLLIAPSLYHQIVFDGESRPGALAYASWFAGASLMPSRRIGFRRIRSTFRPNGRGGFRPHLHDRFPPALVRAWICPSTSLPKKEDARSSPTPLKTKIEQMLTKRGRSSRRPGAAGLPIRLHVHAVVQGTPSIYPVSPRCGSLRRRTVCTAADDPGGPPSDRLPRGGGCELFRDGVRPGRHRFHSASNRHRRRHSGRLLQSNGQHEKCLGRGRRGARCPVRLSWDIPCGGEIRRSSIIARRNAERRQSQWSRPYLSPSSTSARQRTFRNHGATAGLIDIRVTNFRGRKGQGQVT